MNEFFLGIESKSFKIEIRWAVATLGFDRFDKSSNAMSNDLRTVLSK
jgi:hypothetical protein